VLWIDLVGTAAVMGCRAVTNLGLIQAQV